MSEKITKDVQEKIGQLQLLQQRAQIFAAQKQQFQLQLIEVENAMKELDGVEGNAFRLVGDILVEHKADDLKKEMSEKKENIDIRLKSIEKQEQKMQNEASELQKEITEKIK